MDIFKFFVQPVIIAGIAALLAASACASASEKPWAKAYVDLVMTNDQGSELQLDVRQMPLEKVFATITAKTGVPIHYSVVPEGLFTATCVGASLRQVMECLLARKSDLIFRYPKQAAQAQATVSDKNRPAEIWVLGSRATGSVSCAASARPQATVNEAPVSQDNSVEAEAAQLNELLKMAKSNDANSRADAIGALLAAGKAGDTAVQNILEEALSDPNAQVRARAVSSLAQGNDGAMPTAALANALHDTDAGVRLMAVDAAANDAALLQQAVNDSDESVRNLALLKLAELQKMAK